MREYTGLNRAMNKLLAGYSDNELEVIADFMHRTIDAGQSAVEDLTVD
jgi:hypothetical protein